MPLKKSQVWLWAWCLPFKLWILPEIGYAVSVLKTLRSPGIWNTSFLLAMSSTLLNMVHGQGNCGIYIWAETSYEHSMELSGFSTFSLILYNLEFEFILIITAKNLATLKKIKNLATLKMFNTQGDLHHCATPLFSWWNVLGRWWKKLITKVSGVAIYSVSWSK